MNQAVVAYRMKKVRKAKAILLEAVGCKAEKKHEKIEESLSLLQVNLLFILIPTSSNYIRYRGRRI